jgi:hypothetical protein
MSKSILTFGTLSSVRKPPSREKVKVHRGLNQKRQGESRGTLGMGDRKRKEIKQVGEGEKEIFGQILFLIIYIKFSLFRADFDAAINGERADSTPISSVCS